MMFMDSTFTNFFHEFNLTKKKKNHLIISSKLDLSKYFMVWIKVNKLIYVFSNTFHSFRVSYQIGQHKILNQKNGLMIW